MSSKRYTPEFRAEAIHQREFRLTTMCRVLRMHQSGFCAWMKTPKYRRAIEDERLVGKIRTFYQAGDGVYGSLRVHRDLREDGENCGEHKVARLMRIHGLRAIRGYKKPRYRAGKPALVAPNRMEQNFSVDAPDRVWVVVGWSMKSALTRDLVLDALLMTIWRRCPKQPVIVHSDQGSQYGGDDAVRFFRGHGLVPSMSRRGNCFDNAVAESFFGSLKMERIRRRIYRSREETRADVFDYIEVFYNRIRRHSHLGQMSPHAFEQGTLSRA